MAFLSLGHRKICHRYRIGLCNSCVISSRKHGKKVKVNILLGQVLCPKLLGERCNVLVKEVTKPVKLH